ncbi:MAG: DUF5018 domain-containing protein [Tannerella sp.]|nr:DUF5018 domain-containing protein [Tannerella sp.]
MVSIKIENFRGEVDPYVVSFALPGIVDARCFNAIPYPNVVGFPEAWNANDWSIHLVMAKGTDRTKLAPIITLVPGATITPESGTVLDFSKKIEWTLKAPDGSTVKYYMASVFVTGDSDENNMVSIKLKDRNTGAIDPNIISFSLPGIVFATCVEHLPEPNYAGVPESWSPHFWLIRLYMAKGVDCTKLASAITLTPDAAIYSKHADVQDFSQWIEYNVVYREDGSTANYLSVNYYFLAHTFND